MSYLDIPRLHFSGRFQADVSTINNDVRYFDNAAFQEKYQTMSGGGAWNPEGTGIFRLVDCRVTGARTAQGSLGTRAEDSVIGMALQNADDRVFGKLVDLDPQQQMVSQIWGMRLRLTDGKSPALFAGEFAPAAFTNLWLRQQTGPKTDQKAAALYQSVLYNVVWQDHVSSPGLYALRGASEEGYLAIAMNVYGYGRDPAQPRYTLGRVNGTIGPYRGSEPKHFVIGRQMIPVLDPDPNLYPLVPTNGVYAFQGKVLAESKTIAIDLGNALQIVEAGGKLADIGTLQMAVLKNTDPNALQTTVSPDQVAILGASDYQQLDWYDKTAGIQDFDFSADAWCVANIGNRPLALIRHRSDNNYDVLVQESLGGLYVRADDFVYRMNPDQSVAVEFYASRYGAPLSASITLSSNTGSMGGTGAGDQPLDPPVETPPIATPADGATWPATLTTDSHGKAVLPIKAKRLNPQYPRWYIDGQLYGIGYQLTQRPADSLDNFWNYISVLVFSPFQAPTQPSWFADIQPILKQYGNLYPIMSKHLVNLADYDSVIEHLKILELAFSLPIEDPNHMPVTRDLSNSKQEMILKWMRAPGADGLPLKGSPAVAAASAAARTAAVPDVPVHLEPLQTAGKIAVMLEYQARRKAVRQQ
jgi:hypothetical protein